MKEVKDGFILMDIAEFKVWIKSQNIVRQIKRIQNHHTWSPGYSDFKGNDHFERVIAMRDYHVNTNGWDDIAQNITTFPDGTLAICRPLHSTPAGIKGANTSAICIENLGNFDIGKDTMAQVHKDTIVSVNAILCNKFNLLADTDSIVYHHWYNLATGERANGEGTTKTCPGTNFFGGNKVDDAKKNFIPLIQEYMITLEEENPVPAGTLTYGIVTASKLNVRNGAGTDCGIVGSIEKGAKVGIYDKTEGWYKVDEDNKWVSSKYINIVT